MRHRPASFRPARWTCSRETVFAAIEWLESERSLLDAERPLLNAVASAQLGHWRRRSTNSEREETFRPPTGAGSSNLPSHRRTQPRKVHAFRRCSSIGLSTPEQILCHAHAALCALTPARASAVDPCLESALSNSL